MGSERMAHDKMLEEIITEVGHLLANRYDEYQVSRVLTTLGAEFLDARITAYLPILIHKEATRILATNKKAAPTASADIGSVVPSDKLDFLRFEFKYILGHDLRVQIENEISEFMALDPFVSNHESRSYVVRSLYYDDPAYSCYYQKIEGALLRSKFRLRTYTNDPAKIGAIYLEIKGRYNSLVFKRRTGLDATARFTDCASVTEEIIRSAKNSSVIDRFQFALAHQKIQPTMLIEYVRRPYISKSDADFRLTLDWNLTASVTDQLFPLDSFGRRFLPGQTVMEIKFKNSIPLWFHRIIKRHRLNRVSISKVCKGMEACNLVPIVDP